MKLLLTIVLSMLPVTSQAVLVQLSSQESIKAEELNSNFSHIQSLLAQKNTNVSFDSFDSGDLIISEKFEQEFEKVRNLGIPVSPINNEKISAEDLNRAFSQMLEGAIVYDDLPVVENSLHELSEDTPFSASLNFINIVGPSIPEVISPATHGTVTLNGANFTYTPSLNYSGNDSFTYTVSDSTHSSSLATVSLVVNPVNDAPVVQPQSVSAFDAISKEISLIASDVEGSPLTYTIVSPPSKGALLGTGPAFTYTANASSVGNDSFSVKVNDGVVDSPVVTVNINISLRFNIVKGTSYRSYSDGSAATSCAQYLSNPNPHYIYSGNTGTGVYLIDPDGGSLSNSYSEYCNFLLGGANINNAKFQVASAGYGMGPTYIYLNDTYVSVGYGRGWTIVVYNKSLEQISSASFDPYGGGAAASNNMANYLNSQPNGSIIAVVTADEPRDNFNAAASTALSRYGCNVPGLGYRSAYSCVGMKTSSGTARLIGGSLYSATATNQTYIINWRTNIFPY